nr:hypothetical protein [uncultured Carboxylicivirga sp.]
MTNVEQQRFDSKDAYFSHSGINLKRNKFIYKTLDYNTISEIIIVKGFLLKNRLIVILGAFCIIWLAFSILNTSYTSLHDKELSTYEWLIVFFNRGTFMTIWGPILLVLIGIIAIYNAFTISYIAKIKTFNKTYFPRIKEIEKQQEIESLIVYLKNKNIKTYKENE